MRAVALLLALLPTVASAVTPDHTKASCPRVGVRSAGARPTVGAQRLDRLPPANEQRTLYRIVDGCETPVIVRYDVDGRTRRR